MEQENNQPAGLSTDIGEVLICLGEATELTLGSGGGSSEDKRYIYN